MKRIVVCFLLLSLLACSDKTVEKVTKVHRDGTPAAVSIFTADGETLVAKKTFHENGQVRVEGNYLNGEKDGEWTSYYVSGQIWTVNHYKEGIFDGEYLMFNTDESPRIKGHYTLGEESGHWVFYADDGSIAKEVDY